MPGAGVSVVIGADQVDRRKQYTRDGYIGRWTARQVGMVALGNLFNICKVADG